MNVKDLIYKFLLYKDETQEYNFDLYDVPQDVIIENEKNTQIEKMNYIFSSLQDNLEYLKIQYNYLINSDIGIREFNLIANNKKYRAFIFYIDGMVNSDSINDFILSPLMLRNRANTYKINKDIKKPQIVSSILAEAEENNNFNLEDYIYESLIPQNSIKKYKDFDRLISDINSRELRFIC